MFTEIYNRLDFAAITSDIKYRRFDSYRLRDILSRGCGDLTGEDLQLLLSPAADEHLEALAHRAREITRQRFGNVIQLFAPLYISNECRSSCSYCGFSRENDTPRLTLTPEEVNREAALLYDAGIRHILLLTGEDLKRTPIDYIASIARSLSDRFPSLGVEIYPVSTEEYQLLRKNGIDVLALYQETYNRQRYEEVHRSGLKKRLVNRLEGPDRAGLAGMRRIYLGALLGLSSEPATDVYFLARHAEYLMKNYWQTQVAVSLPRLRPAKGFTDVPLVSDREFVRFMIALRLFLPDLGLILSTREKPAMRDNLARICITTMSGASRTDPGGYSELGAQEQFAVSDNRSIPELKAMLESAGIEPVFVDWSPALK